MLKPLLINKSLRPRALKDEIINLAQEIGGDGFNTFSHDDIDELLVDDALSDHDIIDLTLDLTVDGVVGLEGDNDEEEKSTPLTGKLIQVCLQLCSKLENHFLINDPNSERASKLQRELQSCISGYRDNLALTLMTPRPLGGPRNFENLEADRSLKKEETTRIVERQVMNSLSRQCAGSFRIVCQEVSCQVQHPNVRPSVLFTRSCTHATSLSCRRPADESGSANDRRWIVSFDRREKLEQRDTKLCCVQSLNDFRRPEEEKKSEKGTRYIQNTTDHFKKSLPVLLLLVTKSLKEVRDPVPKDYFEGDHCKTVVSEYCEIFNE
ncbi:hypothetical protein TNCV_1147411 [Trichonephila clavipes]|nr:hypothetical protein TNCV_1147411 [Trichonephila clavipes]